MNASTTPVSSGARLTSGGHSGRLRDPARRAFTLVELLVVIALIMVLAGMSLAIFPRVTDGQSTTRAATQLQQWIEIAKQNAARDRTAWGVRLIYNPANPFQVTSLQYVTQPYPYTLGETSVAIVPANSASLTFNGATKTLTGGFTDPGLWPVQNGDYIELGGVLYMIRVVNDATTLTLNSPVPATIATSNYRIIRQARPVGDEPFELAANVIIDLKPRVAGDAAWLPPLPPSLGGVPQVDIMFAPSGRVIGTLDFPGRDRIILWVRDATVPDGDGDPTLIVIYPRTGLIAAHPVNLTLLTTNPYSFTATGQRSSD